MRFGHYDNQNREYVITTYDTPLPWNNYLSNGEMFSLISNLGGGYSFYKDAKLRRITRYTYNTPSRDNNGRFFYIDDGKDVFSPSFYPSKTPLDSYECHVGLNYTRFVSMKNGVEMNLLCFIPQGDNVELQDLTLTNKSNETKTLLVYGGVEFCLWNALDDMTNFQRNFSIGEVEIEPSTIYHKTEYRERRNHFAYYHVNSLVESFDSDRDSFLGIHGDYALPKAIKEKTLTNSRASGWAPIAMEQVKIVLRPGESKRLIFQLGYVENPKDQKWGEDGFLNKTIAKKMMEKYDDPKAVDQAFAGLGDYWDEVLSHFQIHCQDQDLETMVNIWHPYQVMTTYALSRSASGYESGIGRGMGFRDSCQDLLGFVHMIPSLARERILDIASIMLSDGSAMHQYQPLDKKGNADIGGGFNDDPLWLIAATYAYLAETGDYSILDELCGFSDVEERTSLLDHCSKAFGYTKTHLGPHGLPLIGHADWNDCLNLNCFSENPGESFQCFQGKDTGIAESVFIAGMFVKYGEQYIQILKAKGQSFAEEEEAVEQMKKDAMESGYEEDHFLRAYDAFSNPVGSYSNKDGQIYIEPQGMCVMAGLGISDGKAEKALASVKEKLNTPYGICLLSPCYKEYHVELGEVSSYPPGYKENGGIFCHNNPWIIIAETILGHGDQAFEYYKEITPAYIQDISEIHKTEPYVYSQMVAGKEACHFGEAKNSWLTGTASWTYVAAMEHILGIRPCLDGLLIDPCLPSSIFEVTMERNYRQATYQIHVKKTGQSLMTLDGKPLSKAILPPSLKGAHYVEITY